MPTLIDPSFGWRSHRKGTSTFVIVGPITCDANGAWTFDLSTFNLASIVSVSVTAVSSGTDIMNQGYGTIRTASATAITGYLVVPRGVLIGGAAVQFAPAGTTGYVQVWAIPKKPLT